MSVVVKELALQHKSEYICSERAREMLQSINHATD